MIATAPRSAAGFGTFAPSALVRLTPSARQLGHLALGGALGLAVWELFARFLTPLIIGGALEPAALVISLFQNVFGFNPGRPLAELIHYSTGILLYPLMYWGLSRTRSFGTAIDGLLWGIATWFLALGVFATAAGLPFMLGFIPLAWMSLFGHVIYGQLAVALFHDLERRSAVRNPAR